MLAGELLLTDFPVLSPDDELQQAIDHFYENSISHFPVVEGDYFLGILPVDLLMDTADKRQPVSAFKNDYIEAYVFRDHHGLDAFEIIARQELSALPVVDAERHYLGTIITSVLLSRLSGYYSFRQVGGIIVLSLGMHDYNLTEIARIVESNNARILMLYMDTDTVSEQLKMTIKVDTLDLEHIVATFERYKYKIDFYQPAGSQRDELEDRYGLLMKLFDL